MNLAASDPGTVEAMQARVLDLAGQAVPPAFMLELVRLGLSVAPAVPDLGGNLD